MIVVFNIFEEELKGITNLRPIHSVHLDHLKLERPSIYSNIFVGEMQEKYGRHTCIVAEDIIVGLGIIGKHNRKRRPSLLL
jgi:hypothetical protein